MRALPAIAALSLLLGSCAPLAPAPPVSDPVPAPRPEPDVCKGSPPVPRPHAGILRDARCDQDMYAIMASVGDQLGVECNACHVTRADDPSKEDYLPPTPRQAVANWMSTHLMQAVKPADGSKLRCRSCHTDELGRPVLKILGDKRDPVKVNEWMSLVMVRRFVAADGSRLKCKSCHVGTPGTAEFRGKVIGESGQLPAHAVGGKGTPAF